MEILRKDKIKLEEEFRRNCINYERIINNYELNLKEMESSQQSFITFYAKEKEKLQIEIKSKVIENVNNKFKFDTLVNQLEVIEKENESCKKLIAEYRNLIENNHTYTEQEKDNIEVNLIQENFQEMFKQELNEKVDYY